MKATQQATVLRFTLVIRSREFSNEKHICLAFSYVLRKKNTWASLGNFGTTFEEQKSLLRSCCILKTWCVLNVMFVSCIKSGKGCLMSFFVKLCFCHRVYSIFRD